jgi:hypothetical protein
MTTRSPWCWYSLGPANGAQHRLLCLLELQEQGLVGSVADEQHDERFGADRSDADHLAREVAEVVPPQHFPPVRPQRLLVLRDSAAQLVQDERVEVDGQPNDQRISRPDTVLPVHLVAQLEHCPQARAAARLGYIPAALARGRFRLDRVEHLADLVDLDPGMPDLQEAHCGVVRHLGAVAGRPE